MRGVNEMLDAILLPIGEGNRILAQISDGKIDELITQTYKGDHEKMKLAINNVAEVLQSARKDAGATDRSRQSRTSSPSAAIRNKFKGAYADIVRGVNALLDAVIGPLNVSAHYVDLISQRGYPAGRSRTITTATSTPSRTTSTR